MDVIEQPLLASDSSVISSRGGHAGRVARLVAVQVDGRCVCGGHVMRCRPCTSAGIFQTGQVTHCSPV